jgi:hypothetical protein
MIKKLPKWLTAVTPLSRTLTLALFVLLPFGSFYLGVRYQKAMTESIAQVQTVPVMVTSSSTSTSGLKTYKNANLHLSFEYPSTWTLEINRNNLDEITSPDFKQNDAEHVEVEAQSGVLLSIPNTNTSNVPPTYPKNGSIVGGGDVSDSKRISNVRNMNVGGKSISVWDFQGVHNSGIMGTQIQFFEGDRTYAITMFYSSTFDKKILSQILSTFRFQ